MLLIAESLRTKYDITIGVFDTVPYAEFGDHSNYKVLPVSVFYRSCTISVHFRYHKRNSIDSSLPRTMHLHCSTTTTTPFLRFSLSGSWDLDWSPVHKQSLFISSVVH